MNSALRAAVRHVGSASMRSPAVRAVHTEARMKQLGIVLPPYQDAVWSYVKAQRDGDKLYIGDHVGQDDNAVTVRGKVGEEPDAPVTPEQAQKLARQAGLRLLSTLSHYLDGNLDRVDQVIKVNGYVNGTPNFQGHGKVINGCSDLLVEVLEERGKHARTCDGCGSLPAAVTIEMIVRVKDA
eukprot:SRR837773.2745.p1 GENE.SRR837773.2745~~SRR837773.2745.p1  ORF type:complete len:189 (+),score=61.06 SRR837773.2745:22-567(+)